MASCGLRKITRILVLIVTGKNYCFDSWLFIISFHPSYFSWMNFSVTEQPESNEKHRNAGTIILAH